MKLFQVILAFHLHVGQIVIVKQTTDKQFAHVYHHTLALLLSVGLNVSLVLNVHKIELVLIKSVLTLAQEHVDEMLIVKP